MRRLAVIASAIALTAFATRVADAHPLHVSYADVAVQGAVARVTVRAYTDDLAKAAGGAARVEGYVRAHLALLDRAGRALPLASCGATVRGDMTHLCLQTPAGALGGGRMTNDLLVSLYADQINVVRVPAGRTVLFTAGRRVQAL